MKLMGIIALASIIFVLGLNYIMRVTGKRYFVNVQYSTGITTLALGLLYLLTGLLDPIITMGFLVPVIFFEFKIYKGRYNIYNTTVYEADRAVVHTLKKMGIKGKRNQNDIELKGYDKARIEYREMSNAVEVNMKSMVGIDIYEEFKRQLQNEIASYGPVPVKKARKNRI